MRRITLVLTLVTGAVSAADIEIPPKQEVVVQQVPVEFARALEVIVDQLPDKYDLEITTNDAKTKVTVSGGPAAVAVIRELLRLQTGKVPNRGEQLKRIVANRREMGELEAHMRKLLRANPSLARGGGRDFHAVRRRHQLLEARDKALERALIQFDRALRR